MKERACAIVNGYLVRLKEMTNSEILTALEKAQEDSQDSDALSMLNAEPKRGRWISLDMHKGMEQFRCSACGIECYVPTCLGKPIYEYCPNCGAKMGDDDNDD